MKIIDNAIPEKEFKILEDSVFDDGNFPWYYLKNSAYSQYSSGDPHLGGSWFHLVYQHGEARSPLFEPLEPIIQKYILPKIGEDKKLTRVRIGKTTMMTDNFTNPSHIDQNFPHEVAILYLNDSDGPTVLYNERYAGIDEMDSSKLTIMENITPKRNRLLVFDGMHFHSSSYPKNTQRRIMINFNFESINQSP
jgi:hypothetical protein